MMPVNGLDEEREALVSKTPVYPVDESSKIRIGVDLGKKSNAWTSAREVDRETPAKRGSSIHVMSRCPASRTS